MIWVDDCKYVFDNFLWYSHHLLWQILWHKLYVCEMCDSNAQWVKRGKRINMNIASRFVLKIRGREENFINLKQNENNSWWKEKCLDRGAASFRDVHFKRLSGAPKSITFFLNEITYWNKENHFEHSFWKERERRFFQRYYSFKFESSVQDQCGRKWWITKQCFRSCLYLHFLKKVLKTREIAFFCCKFGPFLGCFMEKVGFLFLNEKV